MPNQGFKYNGGLGVAYGIALFPACVAVACIYADVLVAKQAAGKYAQAAVAGEVVAFVHFNGDCGLVGFAVVRNFAYAPYYYARATHCGLWLEPANVLKHGGDLIAFCGVEIEHIG